MTVSIPLANGRGTALVDDEDEWVTRLPWHLESSGYAQVVTRLHRLVLPGVQTIDHINRDKLDCRRVNLRDGWLNGQNPSPQVGKSSQYRGVYRVTNGGSKPWRAQITVGRKAQHLGCFDDEQEAAAVARAARLATFPGATD